MNYPIWKNQGKQKNREYYKIMINIKINGINLLKTQVTNWIETLVYQI